VSAGSQRQLEGLQGCRVAASILSPQKKKKEEEEEEECDSAWA
jgi:hypothetical protein